MKRPDPTARGPGYRRFRWHRLAAVLGLAAGSAVAGPNPARLDFLYVEANVGSSSGGHVALRIGQDVFHYQHDAEGFAVLARDEWARFRRIYNDLDNRNIHVATIGLPAENAARVRDRFVQRHLIQNRHLDFLASLRSDRQLLQHFRAGETPRISGAGFFEPSARGDPALRSLQAEVAARFGAGYLHAKIADLQRQLSTHRRIELHLDRIEITESRFPSYPATFSEIHLDTLRRLLALRILSGGWALAEEAVLFPRTYGIPARRMLLTERERSQLERLERQLRGSVSGLLESPRGDRGYPLLLALARHAAVAESLARGQLILLNPFSGSAANTPVPDTPVRRRALERSVLQYASVFRRARDAFFGLDDVDEGSLNQLENAAARFFETSRGARNRRPFRLPAGIVIPDAPGSFGEVASNWDEAEISAADEAAEADLHRFQQRLRTIYPYNLAARNCATELVRTLNSAFASDEETARALGARLDPDEMSVLVPFRLFELVTERFRTARQSLSPSYRNRKLSAFSAIENPLWIYLAESNTLSSALYRHRRGDTLFLLFTEDLPWLRPAYGAVNLGYGLAQAGAGLITAPFDRGDRLGEGLRGALFSVPELAFVNIRKGSFSPLESP